MANRSWEIRPGLPAGALRRPRVRERRDVQALRQVVLVIDHLPRPRAVDLPPVRAELGVVDVVVLPPHRVGAVQQVLLDRVQDRRVVLVRVVAAAEQRGRQRVAAAVQQVDLALVRGVPEDVVRVVHGADVVADQVVPPRDAGGEHHVRRRVLPAHVVEVRDPGPQLVLERGQVRLVERLDQPALRQLADVLERDGDQQVEVRAVRLHLRHHLVRRVEDRVLDVDAVPVAELVPHLLIDVVVVAEDLERSGLGRQAVGDRRVVLGDRPA